MTQAYALKHLDDFAVLAGACTEGTLITAEILEDPANFQDLIDSELLDPDELVTGLRIRQVMDYSHLAVDVDGLAVVTPARVDDCKYPLMGTGMTIGTLLAKITDEKPNSFGNGRLIAFVSEAERNVAEQWHLKFNEYTTDDMNRHLLVPAPFDRLYVSYLKAMIDFANEEYPSYQVNQQQFSYDFADFVDWLVREDQVETSKLPRRFVHTF